MKKLISLALAMVLVFSLAGVALAFPPEGSVGQPFDEDTLEGVGALPEVTRVHFVDSGDGWYTIMPFRGNFGGTPYLEDGWIMNVNINKDGMAGLYIIVHESDPRWSEDLEPIWGSWAIFQEVHAGRP